ncbi:hypothetical protein GGI17_004343 [Coemansia sp. S146]|nr:hypothetical protein GGI17_004343 [Coemansia sp. S146]
MTHISDLPNNVLELMLFKAATTPDYRLYKWKYKLPLLAVCRIWTKLVIGAVSNQVYVEFATTLRYYLDPHLLWTSNADLFISRGCMLMARRLKIEWEEILTPGCLQRIVLDILKLDCVDWQRINSLTFTSPLWTFNRFVEPVSQDERAATDVARTVQYFSQNLRNITELNWVLDLTLDLSVTRVLPSICGETLRVLKMEDVPHNFAWHHFCYDTFTRPIVFNRLTILHLGFEGTGTALTGGEMEDKTGLGAHNCDQLSLGKLNISHCSRLKFTRVGNLDVDITSSDLGDTADIYRVTNRFFTDICIGGAASLRIIVDWFILDPEFMRWVNLTALDIGKVDYTTVCKAIGRLPNLSKLTISSLEFGDVATDSFFAYWSLIISADRQLAWGEKLAALVIRNFNKSCPLEVCISGIQALILQLGALKELVVPKAANPLVAAFIDMHQD